MTHKPDIEALSRMATTLCPGSEGITQKVNRRSQISQQTRPQTKFSSHSAPAASITPSGLFQPVASRQITADFTASSVNYINAYGQRQKTQIKYSKV